MFQWQTPGWVNAHAALAGFPDSLTGETIRTIRNQLRLVSTNRPDVSIVVPAFNEEATILPMLSSLSRLSTHYKTEIIVANNNSSDRTQELLDACGVRSVFVADQGISYARQAGLELASGRFVLNADADSIYPPTWLDALVKPLHNTAISCTYGMYSFIPGKASNRFTLSLYEFSSETFKRLKRRNREVVDVMGFNFGFRRADGLAVGGFRHDLERWKTGRSEDGWMAYCLTQKGRLYREPSLNARVWTSDRRLQEAGSLSKAYSLRARRELNRLHLYLTPKGMVGPAAPAIQPDPVEQLEHSGK
ncbi:glycosyltransferase family 2 protein [Spirosoma luteolum]